MRSNDIPLLSRIVEDARIYADVTKRILRLKKRYITEATTLDERTLRESLQYVEASIAAGLIVLAPLFAIHNQAPSKFIFVVNQAINLLAFGWLYTRVLRAMGITNVTFDKTLCITAYLFGFTFTLGVLLTLPASFIVGPGVMFGKSSSGNEQTYNSVALMALVQLPLSLLYLYVIFGLGLNWLSKPFNISKKRTLVAWLIAGTMLWPVNLYILGPIFQYIESSLAGWFVAF